MATNTNVFNFDVNPFLRGVQKIGEGMDRIQNNAKKFGDTVTNSIGKGINGLIVKVGLLFAAFKSVGAVLKEMPEIGQAFGIAKDVFLKNLLWPLRQQVMPMLQKMLDWTRDNRARFAQWGVSVANVFRSVVVVARTLWDVMKSLVDTVGGAFQRAFRTNFKSFDEFVNVLSFKVSAVIVYLGMLAKSLVKDMTPAFDWIINVGSQVIGFFADLVSVWTNANKQGDSLFTVMDKLKTTFGIIGNFIDNAVKGFREGFIPAVADMMTPLSNLVEQFNRILTLLGLNDGDGVRGAFKALGSFLGTTFHAALIIIAEVAKGLADSLENIKLAAEGIQKLFKGDFSGASEAGGKLLKNTSKGGTKNVGEAYDIFTGENINDGIVTKDGRVVRTSPDDNIFAAKDFSAYGKKGQSMGDMNFGPFYVTVTEGNAEQAGRSFGEGLAYSFRNRVSSARLAEGF